MKKLKELIKNRDFIQAKVWIIDNRERIEEIADCLLEEIETSNVGISRKHFNSIVGMMSTPWIEYDLYERLTKKPVWETVKDSRTRGEKAKQKLDGIVSVEVDLTEIDPTQHEKEYKPIEWNSPKLKGRSLKEKNLVDELLKLEGVKEVTIYENSTYLKDERKLPPLSFECIVTGGDAYKISSTIGKMLYLIPLKPVGACTCSFFGNVPIYFSRPGFTLSDQKFRDKLKQNIE